MQFIRERCLIHARVFERVRKIMHRVARRVEKIIERDKNKTRPISQARKIYCSISNTANYVHVTRQRKRIREVCCIVTYLNLYIRRRVRDGRSGRGIYAFYDDCDDTTFRWILWKANEKNVCLLTRTAMITSLLFG